MDFKVLQIIFQVVNLLFALSVHEAAHAWTASRLGDQTARMMGRITLNPLRHIDPWGTVIIPLISLVLGGSLIGWAKPTPVNPRNFKKYVRGDVLTTLAGPASNFLLACVALLVLAVMVKVSPLGRATVQGMLLGVADLSANSLLQPVVFLCIWAVVINLTLTVFNLLPMPPLDGSHLVRHMLPYNVLQVYDRYGMFVLIIIFFFGWRIVGIFLQPLLRLFLGTLLSL